MGATITRNGLFPPELLNELVNFVSGHSSLAKLSAARPIGFNGSSIFTFALDSEVDLVAESGAKSNGGATVGGVTITPVKVEYGFRTSDEFMIASDEYRLDVLRAFGEGFAKKLARGLDIMAIHGVNPRTGSTALSLSNLNFMDLVSNAVEYDSSDPVGNITEAIGDIETGGFEVSGLAMSPTFRTAMAALTEGTGSNKPLFPELMFGATPGEIYGVPVDSNSTVNFGSSDLRALVGNFRDYFRWGYAKEMPIEVIEYGNPDNSEAGDLKGHNQVYIRGEAYIGWGILDPDAFAIIGENVSGATGATGE